MKTLMQRSGAVLLVAGLAITPVTAKDMSTSGVIALSGVTVGTALVLYEVYRAQQRVECQEMAPEAFAEKVAYYIKKYPFAFAGLGIATASAATYGVAQVLHSKGGGPNQKLLKDRFEALTNDLANTTLATTIADEIKNDVINRAKQELTATTQADAAAKLLNFDPTDCSILVGSVQSFVETILNNAGVPPMTVQTANFVHYASALKAIAKELKDNADLITEVEALYDALDKLANPIDENAAPEVQNAQKFLKKVQTNVAKAKTLKEQAEQSATNAEASKTAAENAAQIIENAATNSATAPNDTWKTAETTYTTEYQNTNDAYDGAVKDADSVKECLDKANTACTAIEQISTTLGTDAAKIDQKNAVDQALTKSTENIEASNDFQAEANAAVERAKNAFDALEATHNAVLGNLNKLQSAATFKDTKLKKDTSTSDAALQKAAEEAKKAVGSLGEQD